MKYLFCLLVFLLSGALNAQIINIPDANFKARFLSNYIAGTDDISGSYPWTTIDANGNGEIEVAEANLIYFLDLSNASITDLTGLEYFTNLEWLNCYNNNITTLNLTNLTNLLNLQCYNNQISNLNLNTTTLLKYLDCGINHISSLDFSNLLLLENVGCRFNLLSELDFHNNPQFISLGRVVTLI